MKKQVYLFFLLIVLFTLSACNSESIRFSISFDSNGGTSVESIEYQGEETIDIPTLVTKEGHTFDGWFLDNNTFVETFTVDLLLDETVDDDITLYAKWLVNQYHVIYVDDDLSVIHTLTFNYGADLTSFTHPTPPVKEGYTFASWDQSLPSVMPASDITLQATYTTNSYMLTYIDFDGSVLWTNSFDYNTPLSSVIAPNAPEREGYTFTGWDRAKPATMPAENITRQATYSINRYNLNYIDENGYVYYSVSLEYGTNLSSYGLSAAPAKEGYTFSGWSETLPATMPSHDITIETLYTINSYLLTFKDEDGLIISSESFEYESSLSEVELPEGPFKIGYLFIGWFNQDELWTGEDLLMTEDITLQPKYELITYTIEYHLNGGHFESDQPILEYTYETEAFTLLRPTKDGFEFDGWYMDQTYTENPFTTLGGGVTGNITLYAHWVEVVLTSFDPTELNAIFGFNIYELIPTILTNDYEFLDFSESSYLEVYIDAFDWTEDDAFDYMDQLDLMLDYDSIEDSWIVGDYFLYVYEDDVTYPDLIVYGVGIYGESNSPTDPSGAFESEDLNAIFDFDIYAMMPEIVSIDASIFDFSTSSTYDVYIDLFDWTLIDFNNYLDALDQLLIYDETEESWILGDYFIYIYEDDVTYPGELVYGIGIYGEKEVTGEPVENLSNLEPRISINEYEQMTFGQSGLPSKGTYNVLVIPVEISGTPFPMDYLSKLDLVFNGTSASTGWESVASYYEKTSYGLLNLTFDISSKFTTNNSRTYYENIGQDGDQYAIYEALLGKDSTIDYSQYDSNGDGLIDSVIFIYSVDYDYDTDPWWAWVYAAKYGEAENIDLIDEKAFEYYMWASYAFMEDNLPNVSSLVVNAETYIHELGHLMGALDLYSYTTSYGPIGGLGMMDYNNGEHDPMHKLLFGWLQPKVVYEGSHEINIESYALDQDGLNSAIIIPYRSNDLSDGNAFDEFIIIIFYTPDGLYEAHQGFDYILEESAIIVYHVDARMFSNRGFWEGYFVNDNDGESSFIMQVLEVDYNNSIPGDLETISMTDVFTSGVFNLSSYEWNQGGAMNIELELLNPIVEGLESVSVVVSINPR